MSRAGRRVAGAVLDLGSSGSDTLNGLAFSDKQMAVLRGSTFDARAFINRPQKTASCDTEHEEENFRWKLKVLDLLNQRGDLVEPVFLLVV